MGKKGEDKLHDFYENITHLQGLKNNTSDIIKENKKKREKPRVRV